MSFRIFVSFGSDKQPLTITVSSFGYAAYVRSFMATLPDGGQLTLNGVSYFDVYATSFQPNV